MLRSNPTQLRDNTVKRWLKGHRFSIYRISPAGKPQEFEGGALNSRQAANLSSKNIVNCAYASPQSLTGIVHFFEISTALI